MTILLAEPSSGSERAVTAALAGCRDREQRVPHGAVALLAIVLLHGGNGDWDDYVLLLLAPLVVGAVLWVTRRGGEEDDAHE